MNTVNIQNFTNQNFKLRTLTIDDQIYFVGRDVATSLGYKKPANAVKTIVFEDDTRIEGITDRLGRVQKTLLINESGLYTLALKSTLASARNFQRWVTSEVLPSIRRNGYYVKPSEEKITIQVDKANYPNTSDFIVLDRKDFDVYHHNSSIAGLNNLVSELSQLERIEKNLHETIEHIKRNVSNMRVAKKDISKYSTTGVTSRQIPSAKQLNNNYINY